VCDGGKGKRKEKNKGKTVKKEKKIFQTVLSLNYNSRNWTEKEMQAKKKKEKWNVGSKWGVMIAGVQSERGRGGCYGKEKTGK